MQTNNVGNNGPKYSGSIDAAAKIFRRGGIPALWAGLSAAYLRQFSYSAVRMGLFSYLLDHAQRRQSHGHSVSFGKKLFLGSVSGFVGSIIGNPAELAIVRMANDSKLPPGQRRNYKSSLHACARIIRKEGFAGLGRGVINSSIRASVLNAFQFGTYSQAKDFFVQRWPYVFTSQTSIPTMFIGSMCSAFFAVGASMPLDVVKSRLMSIKIRKGQKPIYTGMIDCFRKSYQVSAKIFFDFAFKPCVVTWLVNSKGYHTYPFGSLV